MKKCAILLLLLTAFSLLFGDLTDGLIANYKFNGNAYDESGTGNNGTVYNAILTADRFGNSDNAYEFGSNRYIVIPSDSTLNITNEITMSAWVYLTSSYSWQSIFCKGETSSMNSPYSLLIRDGKVAFLPNRSVECYSSMNVVLNEWVQVALVWNGTTVKYYINAVKDDDEDAYSGQLNVYNNDLVIGKDAPGVTEWFAGKLDDMYLYNRALSDAEIEQLYNNGTINSPQNVEITINNTTVNITWDQVTDATYNVYSSSDPNIAFVGWSLEASGITSANWSVDVFESKKFYRVTTVK